MASVRNFSLLVRSTCVGIGMLLAVLLLGACQSADRAAAARLSPSTSPSAAVSAVPTETPSSSTSTVAPVPTPSPEQIILDYFQALGRNDTGAANSFLAPEARSRVGEADLLATTQAVSPAVVTRTEEVEAQPDRLTYDVALRSAGLNGPGEEVRQVELLLKPEGWRISAVTAPEPTPTPTASATGDWRRDKVIVLDPGHGGNDAEEPHNDEFGLWESDVNLDVAFRATELLRDAGYWVILTRHEDSTVDPSYHGGGYARGLHRDLQARIDIANAVEADLFISIHHNYSASPLKSGTEIFYNSERPFADRNKALADIALAEIGEALQEAGYPAVQRGVLDDSKTPGGSFQVLGPATDREVRSEPTHMPGILVEGLYLSNRADAEALTRPDIRQALARGYFNFIESYFQAFPE